MDNVTDFYLILLWEYLRANLPLQAMEVLESIPKDHPKVSQTKDKLRIKIYALLQDAPRMIFHAESLGPMEAWPEWLYMDLAKAYWVTRAKGKALKALALATSGIPEISAVKNRIATLAAGRPPERSPGDLEEMLVKAVDHRLGYHLVLDNLMPLLWQIHPATCCFDDQIPLLVEQHDDSTDENENKYMKFAELLFEEFQIYTVIFPYLTEAYNKNIGFAVMKIYLSRDYSLFEKVEELKRIYEEQTTPWPTMAWKAFWEKEAQLLGYPECCTKKVVESRGDGQSFELLAKADLIREVVRSQLQPDSPPPAKAYFAYEFYPCQPRCAAAEAIGQVYAEKYRSFRHRPDIFAKFIVPLNQRKIFHHYANNLDLMQDLAERFEVSLGGFGEDLKRRRLAASGQGGVGPNEGPAGA